MGWRFRKRIKLLPGIFLNISKSGFGLNLGIKGANVTIGPNGTSVNTGIPGTGLYRRDRIDTSASQRDVSEYYSIEDNYQDDACKNPATPQHNTARMHDADVPKSEELTQCVGNCEHSKETVDVTNAFDRVAQQASGRLAMKDKAGNGEEDEPNFTIDELKETEEVTGLTFQEDLSVPYDPKLELSHYKYPTLDLLEQGKDEGPSIDMAEQNANKERIIQVLMSFGVEISTIRVTIGPSVTLYEVTLSEVTSMNKLHYLEDDIALSLAAKSVRIIAPMPGRGTIGIEVANIKPYNVSIESILNSRTYQESRMELPCAIGKTTTNEVFMFDLTDAPHVLIAGSSGQGKSVALSVLITSLLYKKHPSELKLVLMDAQGIELGLYQSLENHFLTALEGITPIITEPIDAMNTLNGLCRLMDHRYRVFKSARVRNIKEYNNRFKARQLSPLEGFEYMPYVVVVIDSFNALAFGYEQEMMQSLTRLTQLSRATGIHLIIATKRPSSDIISSEIKSYIPVRISFKVPERIDSQVILDCNGAEELVRPGDMLFKYNKDVVRVQCAFIDTIEVEQICKYISQQQKFPEMTYLPEPPMEEGGSGSSDVDTKSLDAMFGEVARMVVMKQAGSTSKIQREFSIGYNRAGKLMDQLERTGVVGPQIGSKPREVLIQDLNSLETLLQNLGVN